MGLHRSHIDTLAFFGENFKVGKFSVIERDVRLRDHVFIGNNVTIRQGCQIGNRVVIGHNCVLERDVTIGDDTHIMPQTHLTPGCMIAEKVFIGVGVITGDDLHMVYLRPRHYVSTPPRIERGARIGSNSTILPGVVIGQNAVIGMGSLVKCNIPAYEMWCGHPAEFKKMVERVEWV